MSSEKARSVTDLDIAALVESGKAADRAFKGVFKLRRRPHARLEPHVFDAERGRFSVGGRLDEMEDHAGQKTVHGTAPMRQLFGFPTRLRSATQGRAGIVTAFDRFDTP